MPKPEIDESRLFICDSLVELEASPWNLAVLLVGVKKSEDTPESVLEKLGNECEKYINLNCHTGGYSFHLYINPFGDNLDNQNQKYERLVRELNNKLGEGSQLAVASLVLMGRVPEGLTHEIYRKAAKEDELKLRKALVEYVDEIPSTFRRRSELK